MSVVFPREGEVRAVLRFHSPGTVREDKVRKRKEYAEAGVGQHWMVDLHRRTITVLRLYDGGWEQVAVLDDDHSRISVDFGDHGTVDLDLAELLAA